MRISIEIDDHLMREAMRRSGNRTKRATVEAGLRALLDIHKQAGIRKLRGKVSWQRDVSGDRALSNTQTS